MISTNAPGKAVLSGEYAVLRDAPAISAAVDRRAYVSISEASGEFHCLSTPGYVDGQWLFRYGDDATFEWQQPVPGPTTFSLVEEVWKSFDPSGWPALEIVVDSREFTDAATGLKLGLGSSAAVAVALTAALQRFAAQGGDDGESAIAAHNRFLNGRGSGVDVATSYRGGLILYRRSGAEARRIEWPARLRYRYLWSGQAVATTDKLAMLGDDHGDNDTGIGMQRLGELAEAMASAWSSGDAARILRSYPAYIEGLGSFSAEHDLGVFEAGHEDLVRLAGKTGVVYKPCGAGGGDIGIVLAACEHDIETFCGRALEYDFRVLDLALESAGLKFAE